MREWARGEVREWLNRLPWKGSSAERYSWVRIPPSPPAQSGPSADKVPFQPLCIIVSVRTILGELLGMWLSTVPCTRCPDARQITSGRSPEVLDTGWRLV